ncbi:MAG: HAD family hydrolase [Deltaproteobacteria bacterium]|nr:HAD family hydrolase [Deltaproteobacteria bacterium]
MHDSRFRHLIHYLAPIPSRYPAGGGLNKPIRVAIFDIYGTLFISDAGGIGTPKTDVPRVSGLEDVLRQYGIATSPDRISKRLLQSIRTAHHVKKERGISYPEIEIDAIWQDILKWPDRNRIRDFAIAYEWTVNPAFPMPGLDETLRSLRHRGLKMGIISNAQFFTPLLFEWFLGAPSTHLGFDDDLTLYSYQHGEAKPSHSLFNICANRLRDLGFPPESVVFIGNDMLNDIVPAANAGWQTALFAGDRRSLRLHRNREECLKLEPDLVLTDLRQLLEWI